MIQASAGVLWLLSPWFAWQVLAPLLAGSSGWSRRSWMRLLSCGMVLLAAFALQGTGEHSVAVRLAWGGCWLLAALIGFRLARGERAAPTGRPDDELALECERRIGRPVLATTRIRMRTPDGMRTYALALTTGVLWWVEIRGRRKGLGAVIAWRSLEGAVVHTRSHRHRHTLEISRPATFELVEGMLVGAGADKLIGHLTAEEFNAAARSR